MGKKLLACAVLGVLILWSGSIFAQDAGTLKWMYQTGDKISSSPIIAPDGTVYFGSDDNGIYAVNPDGSLKWEFQTGFTVNSSPALASDGTVYVGSRDDNLYAINPDGTLKWQYQTGDPVDASPALASDGTIYVGSYDNYLYAINPDGTLKWQYETGHNIYSSPAIAPDGTVYAGSYDKNLYALNPDGTLKWQYQTGNYIYSSPAIASDGTVYVGSNDYSLYALNSDGTLKWEFQAGFHVESSPAIASDGTIYVGSSDDYLYALNSDGTLQWKYQTGGEITSSPVVAPDGTIYVGSDDINLHAVVGDSGSLATSGWPMFGHDPGHTANILTSIDPTAATTSFSGVVTADADSGLAPLNTTFYTLIAQGDAPFSYSYDFGDGTTPTTAGQSVSHTFDTSGTYTVTVTVTDANADTYQLTKEIVVSDTTTVTASQDDLDDSADQAKTAANGQGVTDVLDDAGSTVEDILDAVSNADAATKAQAEASVKTTVEELVENTAANLAGLIQAGKVADADYQGITENLGSVVSGMIRKSVPITDNTLASAKSVSQQVYVQTLETVLANENLTDTQINEAKTDTTKAQALFTAKPHLLDDVLNTAGIRIDTTGVFDAGEINTVAKDQGLTDQQGGLLYTAIEPTLNVQLKLSDDTLSGDKTIAEFAKEIFATYFGKTLKGYTVEDITGNLLLEFTDGSFVSFLVTKAHIRQDFIPLGLFDLPNGNRLGVTDSYAMEFVSYPVNAAQFMANVVGIGLTPALTRNGSLSVELDAATNLSLKMGWEYGNPNSFSALTTAFSVVGGSDPSAEAYSLLVTYGSGNAQLIPPSIYAMDTLTGWLDTVLPGGYSIDSDTGLLTIPGAGLKLKPDYTFNELTSIDYTAVKAAGGFQFGDLALEVKDFNLDGIQDIRFYSDDPMGSQILYTNP